MTGKFSGFKPATFAYLRALAKNNNRAWFAEHRERYLENVVEPCRSFVEAMGLQLEKQFPGINYDTRMNGSGSMMRIARDTRFSKDKTPYRTSMGFFFWEGSGHKRECPGIFISISAKGGGVYAGKWMFPDGMLQRYRQAVDTPTTGKALVRLIGRMHTQHGLDVGGSQYKRVPRAYSADHPRADLLRYKGLRVTVAELDKKDFGSPGFVRGCAKLARKAAPLHHWLVELNQ